MDNVFLTRYVLIEKAKFVKFSHDYYEEVMMARNIEDKEFISQTHEVGRFEKFATKKSNYYFIVDCITTDLKNSIILKLFCQKK
jgi:hypothetical protein